MMRRRQAAVLVAALLTAAASDPARAATPAAWRADLDRMVANILRTHPEPFAFRGRVAFLRDVEAFKAELPRMDEEHRVVRAMRLMASLHDLGTGVDVANPAFADWYPIRIVEFTDGYFVTSAHRSVADLAGAQVLEIADRPVAQVADDARTLVSADNAFARKEKLYALHNAELMRGLGYATADGSLKVRLKLRSGTVVIRRLTPQRADGIKTDKDDSSFAFADYAEVYGGPFGAFDDWISAYGNLPASAFRHPDAARPPFMGQRRAFYARAIPEHDAYYLQVNAVSNSADETLLQFFQRNMLEIDKQKPRRLVIDLRFNQGGDGSKATAIVHEFIKREGQGSWKELYLLTGPRTNGAAMSLISAFLLNTPVSIVGEPTGTALNTVSDNETYAFPDIGLKQSVTSVRAQMSAENDLADTVQVNYPAPLSFADYVAGRDPALDPILRGEERRSLTVIARADGGAAMRQAYEARKSLRQAYPWWDDPRFIDVKRTGYDLLNAGRAADSVEVFRINTDRTPDEWMSWENLGRGQTGAGQLREARESYRCALAIDPESFDRADMLQAIKDGGGDAAVAIAAGCPAGPRP